MSKSWTRWVCVCEREIVWEIHWTERNILIKHFVVRTDIVNKVLMITEGLSVVTSFLARKNLALYASFSKCLMGHMPKFRSHIKSTVDDTTFQHYTLERVNTHTHTWTYFYCFSVELEPTAFNSTSILTKQNRYSAECWNFMKLENEV